MDNLGGNIYSTAIPGTMPEYNWQDSVASALAAFGNRKMLEEQRAYTQQDDAMKNIHAINQAMAQQGRVPVSMTGQFTPAPSDYAQENSKLKNIQLKDEIENPDKAMQDVASREALSQAIQDEADDPVGNKGRIFNALLAIQNMKSGNVVGQETPAVKSGWFGLGEEKTPASRPRLVNNKIVTEYKQSDGTWSFQQLIKKPKQVSQVDWDTATSEEKQQLYNYFQGK